METKSKSKYSRINEVKARYGNCSSRTIDRGVQEGVIAPPEYLRGFRIWNNDLLDEYDARRPQGAKPPAPRSSGGRGQPKKSTVASLAEVTAAPQPTDGDELDPIASAERRMAENAELYPEDSAEAQ
jgi:hypothetical protein